MSPLRVQNDLIVDHHATDLGPPQRGGGKPALFVTHGLGCRAVFPRLLAKHLGKQYPIVCFQPPGLDGEMPLTSIEAMAGRYLEGVRADQPKGPYALAGYCAGGHIAMEMAHQLVADGDAVAHLFLIDTPVKLEKEPFRALVAEQIAVAEKHRRQRQGPSILSGVPDAIRAFAEALRAYKPRFFDGNVHILASRDLVPGMMDPEKGWHRLVRPDTVLTVVAPTREAIVLERMHVVANVIHRELSRLALGAKVQNVAKPASEPVIQAYQVQQRLTYENTKTDLTGENLDSPTHARPENVS